MPHRRLSAAAALLAALLACSAPDAAPASEDAAARPAVGLMGTIPIYWGEGEGFGAVLSGRGEAHWARAQLERAYRLEPLDVLDQPALAPLDYLLLAQPRALSAVENVALDQWVRDGGRLLLFADPMMTGESRFAIGDRQRPQDVVLLSPILGHWGLELQFDEDQPGGPAMRDIAGVRVPVNLPGRFARTAGGRDCALVADGLLARCTLGQGQATILADAAVLDLHGPDAAAGPALASLARAAFERAGDSTGQAR